MSGSDAAATMRDSGSERVGNDATQARPNAPSATLENDRRHLLRSWSALDGPAPLVVGAGEGAWFRDESGRRWLDFSSQLVNANVGHQHPKLIAAIKAQADTLCTIAPYHANAATSEAARLIAEVAPGDLNRVFFTNGGAEAIENAIRIARLYTGRHKILSSYRSYHGATTGAITATGDPRRWGSEPGAPGFVKFWGPYPYRSAFHAVDEAQECERALAHLADTIRVEGASSIAAILLETVVGANGILVPPDGYLQGVRALCDAHGIVLIADEVMAGFGRCGEWFAIDRWSVMPDLITFAKGVNSGYVPLGGVIMREAIGERFRTQAYPGGLTYSGHPLACAAAVACIGIYRDETLIPRARRLGEEIIGPALRAMQARHPAVGDVRGLGLFWAIELVRNRASREPLVPFNATGADAEPMGAFAAACKQRGLWPFVAANRLHVVPPLVIDEQALRDGLAIIDEALHVADGYCFD
ncbi:aspartate aminotransferase family protein [Lysobacter yangpyeongensis]|uniref:Aspartate aminotransferase family protein n=1 Tax=Lysobacter yangpyeongensis TaxID=346182 RepID=A0ABW0SPT7_9GAMM